MLGSRTCFAQSVMASAAAEVTCNGNDTCSTTFAVRGVAVPEDASIGSAKISFSAAGADSFTICAQLFLRSQIQNISCTVWPPVLEVEQDRNNTDEDAALAVEKACSRGPVCQQCIAITGLVTDCVLIGLDCSCQCEAGFFAFAGSRGIDVCSQCPLGTFKDHFGPETCQDCPLGTESDSRRQACTPCSAGQYSRGRVCLPCVEGTHDHDNDPTTECMPRQAHITSVVGDNLASSSGRRRQQDEFLNVTADFAVSMMQANVSLGNSSITEMVFTVAADTGPWMFGSANAAFLIRWTDAHTRTSSTQQNSRFFCEICAPGTETNADRSGCGDCEAGKYSDDGKSCRACDSGYEPNEIKSGCDMCRKGKFSEAGDDQCRSCTSGRYSDEGSVVCTDCVGGRYDDDNLPDTPCAACALGRYSTARQTTCESCDPGKADLDRDPSTECETCESGNFTLVDATVCTPCPQGQYDHDGYESNFSASTACLDCDPGRFSQTGSTACVMCAAGTFDHDSNARTECSACAIGKHSTAGQTSCTDCVDGTHDHDNNPATACEECPFGTYAPAASINCRACPAGQYDHDRDPSSSCQDCDSGQHSDSGQVNCTDCQTGQHDHDLRPETACEVCSAGSYAPTKSTACNLCAKGLFDDDAKASTPCTECASGTYSDEGSIACAHCPKGQHDHDRDPSTECLLCPTGEYAAEGQTNCSQCIAGKVDHDSQPATPCSLCDFGSYSGPGEVLCDQCRPGKSDHDNDPSTECVFCEPGQITADFAQSGCDACPSGRYSPIQGAVVCMECDNGEAPTYPPGTLSGAASCALCPGGKETAEDKSVCVACEPGEFSTGGAACTDNSNDCECRPCWDNSSPNLASDWCDCHVGYEEELEESVYSCVDIDECASDNGGCYSDENGFIGTLLGCINLIGGRRCDMCPPSWVRTESVDYYIEQGSGNATCRYEPPMQASNSNTGVSNAGGSTSAAATSIVEEVPQVPEVTMDIELPDTLDPDMDFSDEQTTATLRQQLREHVAASLGLNASEIIITGLRSSEQERRQLTVGRRGKTFQNVDDDQGMPGVTELLQKSPTAKLGRQLQSSSAVKFSFVIRPQATSKPPTQIVADLQRQLTDRSSPLLAGTGNSSAAPALFTVSNQPLTFSFRCAPGMVQQLSGRCAPCPKGTEIATLLGDTTNSNCNACPPGRYAGVRNESTAEDLCQICSPGTEPNENLGASTCKPCKSGSYSHDGSACQKCVLESQQPFDELDPTFCVCEPGWYLPERDFSKVHTNSTCHQCPRHAVCAGSRALTERWGLEAYASFLMPVDHVYPSYVMPEQGWWVNLIDKQTEYFEQGASKSIEVVQCDVAICLGAESLQCSPANQQCCREHHKPGSILCAECEEGFSKLSSGLCVQCEGSPSKTVVEFLKTIQYSSLLQSMAVYLAMCIYLTIKSKKQKQDAKITILLFYMQTMQLVSKDSEYFGISRLANKGAAWFGLVSLDMESTLDRCVADLNVFRRFIFKVAFGPFWMWLCLMVLKKLWNSALTNKDGVAGRLLRLGLKVVQKIGGSNVARAFSRKLSRHDIEPDYDGWEDLKIRPFEVSRTRNLLLIFVFSPVTMECLSMIICRRINNDSYLKSDLSERCYEGQHTYFHVFAVCLVAAMIMITPQQLCLQMSEQVKTAAKKALALHERRERRTMEWETRWRMSAKARAERFSEKALQETLFRLAISTATFHLCGNTHSDDVIERTAYVVRSINGRPVTNSQSEKTLFHKIDMAATPVVVHLEEKDEISADASDPWPLRNHRSTRRCIIEYHQSRISHIIVKGNTGMVADVTEKLRDLVGLGLMWYNEDRDDHHTMCAQMQLPPSTKKELVERVLALQFRRVMRQRRHRDDWLALGLKFAKRDFDRQILKAEYGNMLAYISMHPTDVSVQKEMARRSGLCVRLFHLLYKLLIKKVFITQVFVKLKRSLKDLDQTELERFLANDRYHDPFDMPVGDIVKHRCCTQWRITGLKAWNKISSAFQDKQKDPSRQIVRIRIRGKIFWPPWIELPRKFFLNYIYLAGDKAPEKIPWKMLMLLFLMFLAVIHQSARPYAENKENRLEVLALLMLVVVTHLSTLEQYNAKTEANFWPFSNRVSMPGGVSVGLNERVVYALLAVLVIMGWFAYISISERKGEEEKRKQDRTRLKSFWSAVAVVRLRLVFLGLAVHRLQQLNPEEAYHIWRRIACCPAISVRYSKSDIMKALTKPTTEKLYAVLPVRKDGRSVFGNPDRPAVWESLSESERQAAMVLGYSRESWPDPVPTRRRRRDVWMCISEVERQAASLLGISKTSWPPQPLAIWADVIHLRNSLDLIADSIIAHEVLEIQCFEWKLFKQWLCVDNVIFTGPFGPAARQPHHLPEDQRPSLAASARANISQIELLQGKSGPAVQVQPSDAHSYAVRRPRRGSVGKSSLNDEAVDITDGQIQSERQRGAALQVTNQDLDVAEPLDTESDGINVSYASCDEKFAALDTRLEQLAKRSYQAASSGNVGSSTGTAPAVPARDYADSTLADRLLAVRRLQPENQKRLLPAIADVAANGASRRPEIARDGSQLVSLAALEERLNLLKMVSLGMFV
eukprot:SAG31_NODE_265_length_18823_cov_5.968863_12_plen_2593_part_00